MIIGYLDPWGNSDRNLVCDSPTPELQPPKQETNPQRAQGFHFRGMLRTISYRLSY